MGRLPPALCPIVSAPPPGELMPAGTFCGTFGLERACRRVDLFFKRGQEGPIADRGLANGDFVVFLRLPQTNAGDSGAVRSNCFRVFHRRRRHKRRYKDDGMLRFALLRRPVAQRSSKKAGYAFTCNAETTDPES